MARGVVIGAPRSGSGKTTVALGLMAALSRRGLSVQPFKVGPDFIDPGLHALATGRPSYNLDGWMTPREHVLGTYAHHSAGADIAVVEGVMGLFDGVRGDRLDGTTAEIASWLGLPVILVVDASSAAGSVAPLIQGFAEFRADISIPLVVFNNVGSRRHEQLLREAVELVEGVEAIGFLPRDKDVALESRHLGLVTAEDVGERGAWLERLAAFVEEHLDVERILKLLGQKAASTQPASRRRGSGGPVVAVARDRAFCFYYQENLDILSEAGAEIAFFSPLKDDRLPPATRAVYLGGGYPELHAEVLAGNRPMIKAMHEAKEQGVFIYAECGGMIYLSKALKLAGGKRVEMAGLLPVEVEMAGRFQALGYREAELLDHSPFGPPGTRFRGHEFHYSRISARAGGVPAFTTRAPGAGQDCDPGIRDGSVVASYVHLHFGSNPEAVNHMVRTIA